eukprot:CAMPEP_0181102734 /NCGR_PEP_ID=MMETSP1071-20121207/14477_1 /TAXON_ID=35127 /ORGANISM="Thalassiosira sp., Strain NH16" /LENGTH=196 /DNA_ID=CAMNT_0023185735 /DNA_START=290 /DNA_END=880 /DNA_ORIENTATION=+
MDMIMEHQSFGMNDQQEWQQWNYDVLSWDYTDHERGETSLNLDEDDSCHETETETELSVHQKPISSLSYVYIEAEDFSHLFAASMFKTNQPDDVSVDSSRTARISNTKSPGGGHISAKRIDSTSQMVSSGKKTMFEKIDFVKKKVPLSPSERRAQYHSYQSRRPYIRRRSWPWVASSDGKRGVALAFERLGRARAA